MKIIIVLIRHGKTAGNFEKRYIGSTDQPLAGEGIEELNSFVEAGRYPNIELLITSPMLRCVETAELIYPKLAWVAEAKLKEMDFGAFEGKNYQELKHDLKYRSWIDSNGTGNQHGGERLESFKARCLEGFKSAIAVAEKQKINRLGIVCHGGVIMNLMERLVAPEKSFYHWQVENSGGFVVELDTEKEKTEFLTRI